MMLYGSGWKCSPFWGTVLDICKTLSRKSLIQKRSTANIQFFKDGLRYFVHKVVPIQNAYVRKGGITQPEIYGIFSKLNQFIYTLVCTYMPNIRILAKAVLQIFCSQGCSYTKCLYPKKGNNSTENLWNRFKS